MNAQRWFTLWALVVGLPVVGFAVGSLSGVLELRLAGGAAFVLGAGLLLSIVLAATYPARNRAALAALFGPGVKITLLVLFALVLLDAVILVYSVFLIEAALIGRVHIVFLAFVGIGALAGAVAMAKAGLSISKHLSTSVIGRVVGDGDQPELMRFVQAVADRLRTTRPKNIVLGLDPTFYATSAEVRVYPEGKAFQGADALPVHSPHADLEQVRTCRGHRT
jgi:hypothetical protein